MDNNTTTHNANAGAIGIEYQTPIGKNSEAIALLNQQMDQICRAVADGQQERAQELVDIMINQMYDAEQLASERIKSKHTLWVVVKDRCEQLNAEFFTIMKDAQDTTEFAYDCINTLIVKILDGSFGVRGKGDYVSTIQNEITYNGCKLGVLSRPNYKAVRKVKYRDDDTKKIKDGYEVLQSIHGAPENCMSSMFGCSANPMDCVGVRDMEHALADIIVKAMCECVLTTADLRAHFAWTCKDDFLRSLRGDMYTVDTDRVIAEAKERRVKESQRKETDDRMLATIRKRMADSKERTLTEISRDINGDADLLGQLRSYSGWLAKIKKRNGGLRIMYKWAYLECSEDVRESYFGHRLVLPV